MGAAEVDPGRLAAAVDHVEISRLQTAYADVVTRRAWSELTELFRPEAKVEIDRVTAEPLVLVGPERVGGFISGAIERFEFFEFVILNSHIDLSRSADGVAGARIFMQELRQDAESGHWTDAYGVYRDRYERVDGRWWFAGRRYRSLARTSGRNHVLPAPGDLSLDLS
jgi:hypothetical protein